MPPAPPPGSFGSSGAKAARAPSASASAFTATPAAAKASATKAAPALAAAARVYTRLWHRPKKPWRLPSALGVALFSREQCWPTQQRIAFGDLRIGGGPVAKAFATPKRDRRGLAPTKAAPALTQQRRAFRVLRGTHSAAARAHSAAARVWGSTHRRRRHRRQGHCGSRAGSVWACSRVTSACARSSGARLGSYASAAAPAAKALAAPERARRGLVLAGEVPARLAAARVRGSTHR
jgi:hypothetical protein